MTTTLSDTTWLAAIDSARITPLLTDPIGGSATYGSSMAVPGIMDLTITPKVKQVDLNGDNQLLKSLGFANNCDVKFDFSEFSFALVPYIWGGTVTTTGNDPNGIKTWTWGFQQPAPFKLEGRLISETDLGSDVHISLGSVNVITQPPIQGKFQDFSTFSASAVAYKMRSTGVALTLTYNQTAAALV